MIQSIRPRKIQGVIEHSKPRVLKIEVKSGHCVMLQRRPSTRWHSGSYRVAVMTKDRFNRYHEVESYEYITREQDAQKIYEFALSMVQTLVKVAA